MNSIIYDDEINTPENYKWDYYKNFINELDKKDCVKFALFCAKIVNPNTKESNHCIELVEKWLIDKNSISKKELWDAASSAYASSAYLSSAYAAADAANSVAYAADNVYSTAVYATNAAYTIASAFAGYSASAVSVASGAYIINSSNIDIINKYLQILLRKTKQFQNNKILEQISKTDVDKLELVDWNMITDITLEEYNIIHKFDYNDIFSRRCLIELLRREYA